MSHDPDFILFAQHGWADTSEEIRQLADMLGTPNTKIVAPNLGWFKTWLNLASLLDTVENQPKK